MSDIMGMIDLEPIENLNSDLSYTDWVIVSDDSLYRLDQSSARIVDPMDIHPKKKLFKHYQITPESVVTVYTCGFLEVTDYIRCFFKEADILLKVGGTLVVDYSTQQSAFLRDFQLMMFEFSITIGARYRVTEKIPGSCFTRVIFEKLVPTLPLEDKITRWSFGILIDGKMNEKVRQTIDEINSLEIPECEISICGPYPGECLPGNVKLVEDVPVDQAGRGPISQKKNRLIEAAQYNNLVLIHQRIGFRPDWFKGMCDYGNYFEVISTRTEDADNPNLMVQDWQETTGDFADYRNFHGETLRYDQWTPDVRINGAYIVAKRHVVRPILFDERLHQAEFEDIHWSRKLYLAGIMISMNPKASSTSLTYRLKGGRRFDNNPILGILHRTVKTLRKIIGKWKLNPFAQRAVLASLSRRVKAHQLTGRMGDPNQRMTE